MQPMVIALVVAALLAFPAAAVAQEGVTFGPGCTPVQLTYGEGRCPPPDDPPPGDPPGGQLPFTGAETGLIGLAGLALVGFGMALRRLK